MRKAWNYAKDQTEGGMPMQVDGTTPWPFPGPGTMRFDRMHRFTTSRLFAERSHIQKLMIFQALLFIAVSKSCICGNRLARRVSEADFSRWLQWLAPAILFVVFS